MRNTKTSSAFNPRRLLVVVDPSARSQPALEKAARLVEAFGARVELYACEFREGLDGRSRAVTAAKRAHLEAGSAALAALAHEFLPSGLRVEVEYELGHPRAERVLAQIRRSRPDLVVLDSHFHPAAGRALFTHADWSLIRDCPVPLLYAKPARWHVAPRVAVAVDPLHPAAGAQRLDAALVTTARRLARGLKGSLQVVHAWLPIDPAVAGSAVLGLSGAAPSEVVRLLAFAEANAATAVTAVAAGSKPSAAVVLLRGAAVETLPGFAEVEHRDVLVLGAVSRSRLYEALIGATAERLLERVPCDLLIVKAPGRARARIPV